MPHGFSEHAALAVADITGRRANQARNGVLLLELRHVDGGDKALGAIQQIGKRQRGFGLAHTAGAHQQENPDRRIGFVDPRRYSPHGAVQLTNRLFLTENAGA